MTVFTRFLFLAILAAPLVINAQPVPNEGDGQVGVVPAAVRSAIVSNLKQSRPTLQFESVTTTPINGMYAVKVVNGPTLYTTNDGRYFVLGDLFEVTPQGYVNLAEQQREAGRAEAMAGLAIEDMIVFSPVDQPVKAAIMVFTDVDCYYCQKLHQEVPDLNRIGIEVRYLAYPRAGIGSKSYQKIASAWCADDKQDAMNKLKRRQDIPLNVCPDNPVAAQYQLGGEVGVTGTPALITQSGQLMPGYMPALQLAKALGVEVEKDLMVELMAKQARQKQ